MTIQEQQLLIAMANLLEKLESNDTTVIGDIEVINNTELLTLDTKTSIELIIEDACRFVTKENKDLLKRVVTSLSFVDQTYFLESIEITTIDRADFDSLKMYLDTVFSKQLTFKTSRNEYFFYSRLVNRCIGLRDTAITKKLIDRLQSIHVA